MKHFRIVCPRRAICGGEEHHAQTTLLVLFDLVFNSLVRLSGILRWLEGVSRHTPNDSGLGARPKELRPVNSHRQHDGRPSQPEERFRFTGSRICFLLATMFCLSLCGSEKNSGVPKPPSLNPTKSGAGHSQQININRATVSELKTLPGIGEATAQRIVEYRRKNPPFRRIEELLIIRGISRNRLEQIRHRIRLD